jgi:hypothetical protein
VISLKALLNEDEPAIDPEVQLSVILASEQQVKEHERALRFIQENEKVINSENFQVQQALKKKLHPLEVSVLTNVEESCAQSDKLDKLLTSYNDIVSFICHSFQAVCLHSLTHLDQFVFGKVHLLGPITL